MAHCVETSAGLHNDFNFSDSSSSELGEYLDIYVLNFEHHHIPFLQQMIIWIVMRYWRQ